MTTKEQILATYSPPKPDDKNRMSEDLDDWLKTELEQRRKAGHVDTIVMWRFSKIEKPESGDSVWACNARDKEAKLIKWGIGDEAFYSYWLPADKPKPPQA